MSQELQRIDTNTGVISAEILENYKSYYYLFKSRRDTDIKVFNGGKVIRRSDLLELNRLMTEKFHLHTIHSKTFNISIVLANGEMLNFGTWGSFESYTWIQSSQTMTIVVEWEFNVLHPNHQQPFPQTHTMRLRIGGALRPGEFFHVLMAGAEDSEMVDAMSDVVCKIDFVNTTLCGELRGLISLWYDGLPEVENQKWWIEITQKHKGKIKLTIITLILFLSVVVLNLTLIAILVFLKLDKLNELFKWFFLAITMCIPFIYAIWKITDHFTEKIVEQTVGRYKSYPKIELTKGDFNRAAEIKRNNGKLFNDLIIKIAVTLIVSAILLFFGQWIPQFVTWFVSLYRK